ncbi:MAG TPA: discoidin domain-containing protein [Oscillatoriaceae cyanobacterium]
MSLKRYRAAVVAATLLAGCGQLPGSQTNVAPGVSDANTVSFRYNLMQTGDNASSTASPATTASGTATSTASPAPNQVESQCTVTNVTASSDRNDQWFDVNHVIDGNTHSSWGPAADDAHPTLTFTLNDQDTLSGIAVKMSHAAMTIDVAVSTDNKTWTTVGTGLNPTPTVLDRLTLTQQTAKYVRLTFNGQDTGSLLVCEVQFFCSGAAPSTAPSTMPSNSPSTTPSTTPSTMPSTSPSTAPSTMPSTTPSTMPSETPMPTPTPMPTSSAECCKVTGGGFVAVGSGHGKDKVTFGFVAQDNPNGVQGNIEVNDHLLGLKFHGRVTALDCDDVHHIATFSGVLSTGVAFTCTVTDNGEPGRADTFAFSTAAGFKVSGTLAGGNIQDHDSQCRS